MAERLQLRRDTAEQWDAVNPVLRLCEIGLVIDATGQVTGMKIGDGRVWRALPLIPIGEKVGTSGIADGAVTSAKIDFGVVTANMLKNTMFYGEEHWLMLGTAVSDGSEVGIDKRCVVIPNGGMLDSEEITLKKGVYVISFSITDNDGAGIYFEGSESIVCTPSWGAVSDDILAEGFYLPTVGGRHHIVLDNTGDQSGYLEFYNNGSTPYGIYDIKLERGSVPTAWSMALEDYADIYRFAKKEDIANAITNTLNTEV